LVPVITSSVIPFPFRHSSLAAAFRKKRTFIFGAGVKCDQQDEETTVDDKQKQRNVLVDKLNRSEPEIELIPDGPGKWILNLVGPQGLEIRPGDTVLIDNAVLDELMIRSPNGTLLPVKFEADKLSMTKKKAAKAK
jgi:invasion protein IalB